MDKRLTKSQFFYYCNQKGPKTVYFVRLHITRGKNKANQGSGLQHPTIQNEIKGKNQTQDW